MTPDMPEDPFGDDDLASDRALALHDEMLGGQGAGHSRESAFERLLAHESSAGALFDDASERVREAIGFLVAQIQDLVRAGFTETEAVRLVIHVLGVHAGSSRPNAAAHDVDQTPIPPPTPQVREHTTEGWQHLVTLEGVGPGQTLRSMCPTVRNRGASGGLADRTRPARPSPSSG